ncbi:MAG: hypothetical protein ACK5TH_02745 [Prosthecobacter sp.]
MRTLASFLENPFDDDGISMNELIAFATDHLQRLIANNPNGELNDRIAPLTSSLATVEDCVTDDQGRLGLRKARKQAKDDFRLQIPVDVKRIEAGFIAAFGADSPVLLEALPQGRTIFQTCRDDQVEVHLQTLLDAATTHQASLAPATLTQATTLKNNWVTIYQASEASTGSKTVTQEGKKLARENLQLMLFLNLLKLAEMFPRQPEKLALYMMQHLLENPSAPDEPTPPVPPTP